MGDMADMVNDDHWDGAELYQFGGTITCKFCHQDFLHWEKTFYGSWRLHDSYGVEHDCEILNKWREGNAKDHFAQDRR